MSTIPCLDNIAELFSAVSEKRLELVRHVAGEEGLQIRPLARALGRNYKNVHTACRRSSRWGSSRKTSAAACAPRSTKS